jgi:hypothetical protein
VTNISATGEMDVHYQVKPNLTLPVFLTRSCKPGKKSDFKRLSFHVGFREEGFSKMRAGVRNRFPFKEALLEACKGPRAQGQGHSS